MMVEFSFNIPTNSGIEEECSIINGAPKSNFIRINGSINRIPSTFCPRTIQANDKNILSLHLQNFLLFHDLCPNTSISKYIQIGILFTNLWMAHLNPLDPRSMLYAIFSTYIWILDDTLETLQHEIVPTMRYLVNAFSAIIKKEKVVQEFQPSAAFQNFPKFIQAFQEIIDRATDIIPEYNTVPGRSTTPLVRAMSGYLQSFELLSLGPFCGEHSTEEFSGWRRWNGCCDLGVEFAVALTGLGVDENVRHHPLFQKSMELACLNLANVNDLLGMGKDFKEGDSASVVTFGVFQKNMTISKSVEMVVNKINSQLIDYVRFRNDIVKLYEGDEEVSRFFEFLDNCIDSHYFLYTSPRYNSEGCIKIVG